MSAKKKNDGLEYAVEIERLEKERDDYKALYDETLEKLTRCQCSCGSYKSANTRVKNHLKSMEAELYKVHTELGNIKVEKKDLVDALEKAEKQRDDLLDEITVFNKLPWYKKMRYCFVER